MRYVNSETGELHIPEFAHGYLLCYSLYHAKDVRESGEDDSWEQVTDVPLSAGKNCEYATYDLNFWLDDEDGKMYCTAYEVWFDEEGQAHTKTYDEHRRLW